MNVASQAVSLFDDGAIVSGQLVPDCLFYGTSLSGVTANSAGNTHIFPYKTLVRNIYLYNASLTNTREVSILIPMKFQFHLNFFRRTLQPKETIFLEQLNWVIYESATATNGQPHQIIINAEATADTTALHYIANGAYIR